MVEWKKMSLFKTVSLGFRTRYPVVLGVLINRCGWLWHRDEADV